MDLAAFHSKEGAQVLFLYPAPISESETPQCPGASEAPGSEEAAIRGHVRLATVGRGLKSDHMPGRGSQS